MCHGNGLSTFSVSLFQCFERLADLYESLGIATLVRVQFAGKLPVTLLDLFPPCAGLQAQPFQVFVPILVRVILFPKICQQFAHVLASGGGKIFEVQVILRQFTFCFIAHRLFLYIVSARKQSDSHGSDMNGVIRKALPPQGVEAMLYNKMLLKKTQAKILGPAKKTEAVYKCHQVILTGFTVGYQVRPNGGLGGIYRGFVKDKVTSESKTQSPWIKSPWIVG